MLYLKFLLDRIDPTEVFRYHDDGILMLKKQFGWVGDSKLLGTQWRCRRGRGYFNPEFDSRDIDYADV